VCKGERLVEGEEEEAKSWRMSSEEGELRVNVAAAFYYFFPGCK
jgi:hypothetical protein